MAELLSLQSSRFRFKDPAFKTFILITKYKIGCFGSRPSMERIDPEEWDETNLQIRENLLRQRVSAHVALISTIHMS